MPAPKDPIKREEWIKNLSKSKKGKRCGKDSPNFGKHPSEETRKKMSMSKKDIPRSKETCEKISNTEKGKKRGPPSEETRRKMSISQKNRIRQPHSKETCEKIRKSNKGKKHRLFTKETREKMGKSRAGEKHYNWKGGISFEPYCPKFTKEFKERVRAFFEYQCQMPGCNHIWQPGEKKLAVHHVNFRKDSCCTPDAPRLFVPLCPNKCHSRTNANRPYWEQLFTELIMTKYNGQCYLPKTDPEPSPARFSPLPVSSAPPTFAPSPAPATLPVSVPRH